MEGSVTDVNISVTDVVSYSFLNLGGFMANQFTENSVAHINIGKVCGVYLITDTTTGRNYVGSSSDIRMRMVQHFFSMSEKGLKKITTYNNFYVTYKKYGSTVFTVKVLEECLKQDLKDREIYWIAQLNPSENTQHTIDNRQIYSDEERNMRSERTKKLWADPEYREKAVSSRLGKAYNKGYKCTPEQVENRKKAARISNMKRKYGEDWKEGYLTWYPDKAEDLDGR